MSNWMDEVEKTVKENENKPKDRTDVFRPWNFYMETGEDAVVTVLPYEPIITYERQLVFNGKKIFEPVNTADDIFEKLGPIQGVLPKSKRKTYTFICIDHRKSNGKKDPSKTYKDQIKLLCVRDYTNGDVGDIAYFSKLEKKENKGFSSCRFDVSRGSDIKTSTIGDKWDFDKKFTVEELCEKYPDQMKESQEIYRRLKEEWSKPKTKEQLINLYYGGKTDPQVKNTNNTEEDDDCPFG